MSIIFYLKKTSSTIYFLEQKHLVFLINIFPALRCNLVNRTPVYKDFHNDRGYKSTFCFFTRIFKRKYLCVIASSREI